MSCGLQIDKSKPCMRAGRDCKLACGSRHKSLMEYIFIYLSGLQMEGEEWLVKPMNCPLHVNIYKSTQHSYRNLPLRYAELGTVYRYERSGTLHGLFRVRGFTQVSICTLMKLYQAAPLAFCNQSKM